MGIEIELGRIHNRNKNPIADNACKEFHKEAIKLGYEGKTLTNADASIIAASMNKRIRQSGHSSKEIWLQRDDITNEPRPIDDEELIKQQKGHELGCKGNFNSEGK